MGIGAGLGIVNKVMSRFNWDRKSLRRNKIAKLRKQRDKLTDQEYTTKLGYRLDRINAKLKRLLNEAIND